jgi:hypothetical protein
MSRRIALIDEVPTRQEQHLAQVGADLYVEVESDCDEEEPSYGADPFDIVAHREELGLLNDD